MRSIIAIGLAAFCSIGCQKTPDSLLELKYILTPTQVSAPAIGGDLPLYVWHYRLLENSPEAKFHIQLELRREGQETYSICEFTPEYLSTRAGRDLVISVTRPEKRAGGDSQFQIRLLDAQGNPTAISANNNNCPQSTLRPILNSRFDFPIRSETEHATPNEEKLWQIRNQNGQILGNVFLVVRKL